MCTFLWYLQIKYLDSIMECGPGPGSRALRHSAEQQAGSGDRLRGQSPQQHHYRLNVCVLPKIYVLTSKLPTWRYLEAGPLGGDEVRRVGPLALMKEAAQLLRPFHHVRWP